MGNRVWAVRTVDELIPPEGPPQSVYYREYLPDQHASRCRGAIPQLRRACGARITPRPQPTPSRSRHDRRCRGSDRLRDEQPGQEGLAALRPAGAAGEQRQRGEHAPAGTPARQGERILAAGGGKAVLQLRAAHLSADGRAAAVGSAASPPEPTATGLHPRRHVGPASGPIWRSASGSAGGIRHGPPRRRGGPRAPAGSCAWPRTAAARRCHRGR